VKWEEMFGVKEEVVEEVNVKKPRKKAAMKKPALEKSTSKQTIKEKAKSNLSEVRKRKPSVKKQK